MNRRSFIRSAAIGALTAPALVKAATELPLDLRVTSRPIRPLIGYQRFYTKVEVRPDDIGSSRSRWVWINGWTLDGERDVFFQRQALHDTVWTPSHTYRWMLKDANGRILDHPKLPSHHFHLDYLPYNPPSALSTSGVVAIARWTEQSIS